MSQYTFIVTSHRTVFTEIAARSSVLGYGMCMCDVYCVKGMKLGFVRFNLIISIEHRSAHRIQMQTIYDVYP